MSPLLMKKRHVRGIQVGTKNGCVEGFQIKCDRGPVNIFLGIPYADPPVGELRFKVNKKNKTRFQNKLLLIY